MDKSLAIYLDKESIPQRPIFLIKYGPQFVSVLFLLHITQFVLTISCLDQFPSRRPSTSPVDLRFPFASRIPLMAGPQSYPFLGPIVLYPSFLHQSTNQSTSTLIQKDPRLLGLITELSQLSGSSRAPLAVR